MEKEKDYEKKLKIAYEHIDASVIDTLINVVEYARNNYPGRLAYDTLTKCFGILLDACRAKLVDEYWSVVNEARNDKRPLKEKSEEYLKMLFPKIDIDPFKNSKTPSG